MPDLVQVLDHDAPAGADGGALSGIVVDHRAKDDAAVVAGPRPGYGLVLTADVIAPLVDDPEAFGAIAACNSLSDVYAMGGEPKYALNLAFFPDDKLALDVLVAIQRGAAAVCRAAGVAVVGGHTVRDPELKFGLSVTGEVALDAIWANTAAQAGQVLVLTKALGTGVLGQAIKQGAASAAETAAAIASMTTLNRDAAAVGRAHGVTAATDITGFGLIGHLRNIVRGSGLAATVTAAALPVLPGVDDHIVAGRVPGGSKTNRTFLEPGVAWRGPDADRDRVLTIACDAQTSGGLLLCVPPDRADAAVAALRACGLPAAAIGVLHAPQPADAAQPIAIA
ncbi:MAG: selenide, water dikinase SelD [Myxococcales bacterium]|nr:selenide, water dikinase SelD [Myxococcales bacterium]